MNTAEKLSYQGTLEESAWDAFRDTDMLDRLFENGLPTDAHEAFVHCRDVLPEKPVTPAEQALESLLESFLPKMMKVVEKDEGTMQHGTRPW